MSTFVPSSGAISIAQIKAAFPNINSNSLGDYRGVKWFRSDNSRGYFPSGGNAYVSMSAFYGTSGVSPAVPGGFTIGASQSWTIPMFNRLTITLKGGDGGKSGDYGIDGCNNNATTLSLAGGSGNPSIFSKTSGPTYTSASGGTGGSGNGVFGSPGSTTTYVWDADTDSSVLSHQYENVTLTVGTGGSGGTGGINRYKSGTNCYFLPNSSSGSAGANGYITVSWT